MAWLTIPEAAKRVSRSPRTIYWWIELGHLPKYFRVVNGRGESVVRETALLEVDRAMRSRRGRPPTPPFPEYVI